MVEERPPSPFIRIQSLLRTGPQAIIYRFASQIFRIISGYDVYRMSMVTPQLFVGGQHRPRGWAKMRLIGITAVVNMREPWHDDVKKGIGGERHLHLATRDNTPPAIEQLDEGVRFIADEIERGGKVYVHCGVGVGRAPTMAAAYLVSTGMTVDEALDAIRKVRPFIHPTSKQIQRLHEYAAWLTQHRSHREGV